MFLQSPIIIWRVVATYRRSFILSFLAKSVRLSLVLHACSLCWNIPYFHETLLCTLLLYSDLDSIRIEASKSVLAIGERLTIRCNLVGNAGPSVVTIWKKNGIVLSRENVLSFIIRNISDGGYYECSSGRISNGVKVTVKGRKKVARQLTLYFS